MILTVNNIEVSNLSIYPVKSCRGTSQNSARVEAFGLENDRRWMVVDENGVMLTQRKISKMCLIQPEVIETGLVLKTSDMDNLFVETPLSNKKVSVKVWSDECQAYDAVMKRQPG